MTRTARLDWGGGDVPLSEEEQRILTEIEHQLRASDPELVRQVSTTTVFTAPIRHTKVAAVGLVVSLAVMLLLLVSVNAVAAFVVGFLPMFACGISLERSLRHLAWASLDQIGSALAPAERSTHGDSADRFPAEPEDD